jgi:hypothetical protein
MRLLRNKVVMETGEAVKITSYSQANRPIQSCLCLIAAPGKSTSLALPNSNTYDRP